MSAYKPDDMTDAALEKLERRISLVYKQAADDLKSKIESAAKELEAKDKAMRKKLESGKITQTKYDNWRKSALINEKRLKKLEEIMTERYIKADEVAASYINDTTPTIYSLNYNYEAYTLEKLNGDIGFSLINEQAVRRLIVEDPELLPFMPAEKAVEYAKDYAWTMKRIKNTILSAILQGDSIPKIAKKLMQDVQISQKADAIRTARTAITSAQNGGRQATFEKAAAMGIKVRKRWTATKDMRTRPSHGAADGQIVDVDEPFTVGGAKMMYPGDPSGPGRELYNCRCSMRTVEKPGIEKEQRKMRVKDVDGNYVLVNEMTYNEWVKWKDGNQGKS